jgi:hypothetical protein
VTHQIRAGLRQLLVQEPGRVDTGCGGHRCDSFFEVVVEDLSKNHPVTVTYLVATLTDCSYTTLLDSTRYHSLSPPPIADPGHS